MVSGISYPMGSFWQEWACWSNMGPHTAGKTAVGAWPYQCRRSIANAENFGLVQSDFVPDMCIRSWILRV